jgi:hypothetical protein
MRLFLMFQPKITLPIVESEIGNLSTFLQSRKHFESFFFYEFLKCLGVKRNGHISTTLSLLPHSCPSLPPSFLSLPNPQIPPPPTERRECGEGVREGSVGRECGEEVWMREVGRE